MPTWSVLFGRRDSQNDTLLSRAPCAVELHGLLSCLDFDDSYWVRVTGTDRHVHDDVGLVGDTDNATARSLGLFFFSCTATGWKGD